jgi:hypothetical protein
MINEIVGLQWGTMLRSEETPIAGGGNANGWAKHLGGLFNEFIFRGGNDVIEDETFNANCYRLGRTGVSAYSRTSWRWLGYFFGVDLLISYDYGLIHYIFIY